MWTLSHTFNPDIFLSKAVLSNILTLINHFLSPYEGTVFMWGLVCLLSPSLNLHESHFFSCSGARSNCFTAYSAQKIKCVMFGSGREKEGGLGNGKRTREGSTLEPTWGSVYFTDESRKKDKDTKHTQV